MSYNIWVIKKIKITPFIYNFKVDHNNQDSRDILVQSLNLSLHILN